MQDFEFIKFRFFLLLLFIYFLFFVTVNWVDQFLTITVGVVEIGQVTKIFFCEKKYIYWSPELLLSRLFAHYVKGSISL